MTHLSPENAVWNFAKAILHGDDEHRAWLLEAAVAFEAGEPIPAPKGSGIRAQQMPSRETLATAILKAEIDHPRKLPGEKRSLGYYTSVGLDAFSHPHDALGRLALAAAEACLSAFTSPESQS